MLLASSHVCKFHSRRGSKKFEDWGVTFAEKKVTPEIKNFETRGFTFAGGEVSIPLHAMSQMPYNVIFPTEINFPIRSRYLFVFYIFLSYLATAFVMFDIFTMSK